MAEYIPRVAGAKLQQETEKLTICRGYNVLIEDILLAHNLHIIGQKI